jgi:hypothetical protein
MTQYQICVGMEQAATRAVAEDDPFGLGTT